MFQVDGGRSVAIHPTGATATSAGSTAPSLLADELDDLLGEQLMPLRARSGKGDEPYLLAVDASGQPVVVEIVPVLDHTTLLRSLTYAGRAARMSTQDLARTYRGGEDRFTTHFEAFRETVSATALLSTNVRAGSRLLLVCAQIADGVTDALEFLLQLGWQVRLLQVGVRGADGSRVVDVAPLTRHTPARKSLDPSLRLVRNPRTAPTPVARSGHTHPSTRPTGPDPMSWTATVTPRTPEVVAPSFARRVGEQPAASGTEPRTDPGPTTHAPLPAWERSAPTGSAGPAASARPAASAGPAAPSGPAASSASPRRPDLSVAPEPPTELLPPVPPLPGEGTPSGVQDPVFRSVGSIASAATSWDTGQMLPTVTGDRIPVADPAHAPHAPAPGPAPVSAPTGPDPRLLEIARDVGEPVLLSWNRHRQHRSFHATLRTDGFIELPDGSVHADPSTAAERVSESIHPMDGWRLWRLGGDDGPTFAEALGL